MDDNTFWAVIMIALFVTLGLLGGYAIKSFHEAKTKALSLGYEQVMVVGSTGYKWQKVR